MFLYSAMNCKFYFGAAIQGVGVEVMAEVEGRVEIDRTLPCRTGGDTEVTEMTLILTAVSEYSDSV